MIAVALLAAVAATSCTLRASRTEDSSAIKTIQPGTLTLGTCTPFPPFETQVKGRFEGFDIDLAREVARLLGLRLKVVNVSWEGAFPALKGGRFDVLAAAIGITEERKKTLDFSDPYLSTRQALVCRKGSSIRGPADLGTASVGVLRDSTGEDVGEAIDRTGNGIGTLERYDTINDAFPDLVAGDLDALINDLPASAAYIKARPGLRIAASVGPTERYGLVFKKGNPALVRAVNAALKQIETNGTRERLSRKWFGTKL